MANKLLGQHFLKDRGAIDAIIRALAPAAGDTVIEIGPGHGELTVPLAEACQPLGVQVIAIEKDRTLGEPLAKRLADAQLSGTVSVLQGDALTLLPGQIAADDPRGPVKIAGNIPYYLSGHLLRVVSELPRRPARCVFTVQQEVAERITAAPPQMNRLAASVQFWAAPSIIARVPREHFTPVPQVNSAIITLETLEKRAVASIAVEDEAYYRAVRALFAQPRKTLLNNVAASKPDASKEEIASQIRALGTEPGLRPQDLTVAAIIRMAAAFYRA